MGGGRGGGSERLGCFQDILLRFLRLAPAVGLSKDEFEFSTYSTPFLLPFYLLSSLLTSLLPSFRARSNPPPTTYDAPPPGPLLRIFLVHADFHKSIFHSFVSSLSERKVNDRNRTWVTDISP